MRTGLIIALSVCCLLGHVFGQEEQPQQNNAWLRFTHGYSTSGPVDVYIDNLPTASWNWVPFRQVTAYKPITPGEHSLTLVRANATRMGADQGQNEQRQEGMDLSQFFSSEDILLNANFELREETYYSFAWFAEQQMEEQTQQEETQEEEAGEQQNRQEDQELMEGLIRETSSWSLYIDRLETAQGQARLRWIHLVPEFEAISIFLQRVEEQQNRQEEEAFVESLTFPNASNYMNVEPGLYNIIIRRSQQGEEEQGDQNKRQEEEEELRRIERVELLSDSVYTGWVLGPLQDQAQQQEMSQIAAILKFDSFELLREMNGQN